MRRHSLGKKGEIHLEMILDTVGDVLDDSALLDAKLASISCVAIRQQVEVGEVVCLSGFLGHLIQARPQ